MNGDEIDVVFPTEGMDESTIAGKQPPTTTREAQNVRLRDSDTGMSRGGQRSGLSKQVAGSAGGGKIADGFSLNVDNKNLTNTAYGATNAPVIWSSRLPQKGGPYQVAADLDGNSYWTDYPKGVSKLNQSQQQLWTISPPVLDPSHEIKTLCVEESGWVFTGVSSGGDQKKALIFGYQQGNDNACDFVWSLQIGMYASQMKVVSGELYVLCEDTAFNRAYVRVYAAPTTAAPILTREWRVSYPANSFDVDDEGKILYTAHEPMTARNFDTASVVSTSWWEDWTPKSLANIDKRLWCWLDANDIDGDGSQNSAYSDGDIIEQWTDKSGNFRNLYVNKIQQQTERGPSLRKKALSGKDVLRFNGQDQSMASDDSTSTGNLTWLKVDRAAVRSLLPLYTGAQFAMGIVLHCDPEEAMQVVLGQDRGSTHDNAAFRGIFTNHASAKMDVNEAAANTYTSKNRARIGTVQWYETTTAGEGTGGHGPYSDPVTPTTRMQACGFQGGSGTTLITIVHGAGYSKSVFRVNGRPVDDWTGIDVWKGHDPTFIGWCRSIAADNSSVVKRFGGLLAEIVVLADWYTQSTNPLADPTRQTLIELPAFYAGTHDFNASTNVVTELEMLEGYLAHKWGIPHKLPVGSFNALLFSAIPANNDSVTLNGTPNRTYTFKTALTGAADEIYRGASPTAYSCAVNLFKAMNNSGQPGVDYGTGTVVNADWTALGVTEYGIGTHVSGSTYNNLALAVQSRSTVGTRVSMTSGGAGATNPDWDEVTSYGNTYATGAIGNTNTNIEHFPHRYYLTKVAVSGAVNAGTATGNLGGPPRADGKKITSAYQNLSSPYGMVCRWSAATGKLGWICTANDNLDGTGRGALGYGVVAGGDNRVYSMGPRHTTVSPSNIDVRCLIDQADYYSEATADGAWTLALTTPTTFSRPRMGVDDDDNLYFPYFATATESPYGAYVYTKTGTQLHAITLSNYDLCRCIAPVPGHPDWGTDLNGTGQASKPRAEYAYIGARIENTATITFSGQPIAGAGESVFFTTYSSDFSSTTNDVYTFVNPVVNPGDVLIDTTLAGTVANLAAAINGGAGAGTKYIAAAWTPSRLVRAENITSTAMTFRAIDPIQTLPRDTIAGAIVADGSPNTHWTWSGRTLYGVNNYLTSQTSCAYLTRLVHPVLSTGSPRRLVEFCICANSIKVAQAGAWTSIGTFTSTSQYHQIASLFQKVYFTNGDETFVVDAKESVPTATALAATGSGPPPPRCKLIESWRGRLVMARSADDAHNWHMSAVGDPTDWDTDPPVMVPTQAISGDNSLAGKVPDMVNCIAPISDDLLLFGCDSSIWRLTGDPMAGGQLDLVSNITGMAFGRPYCTDGKGNLYFMGSRGNLYLMAPGGKPEKISSTRMPRSLANFDFSSYYVRLAWNDQEDSVHIIVCPFGPGGTQVAHYAYEVQCGFWKDYFGTANNTTVQPTAVWVSDGDQADDRVVLFGCEDGYVRRWDRTAKDDDGVAISASVLFGPYSVAGNVMSRLAAYQVTLGSSTNGANVQIYASDVAESRGSALLTNAIPTGMSGWFYDGARGRFFWVMIEDSTVNSRWAVETLRLRIHAAGRSGVSA